MVEVGKEYGNFVVVSFNEEKSLSTKRKYYNCKCKCGNMKVARDDGLKSGSVSSCGCSRIKNLTGEQFDKLTVISLNKTKRGQSYWNCVCCCGDEVVVRGTHLTGKNVRSCGRCYNIKDIGGKRFGHLTVIRLDTENRKRVRWICKCDCGNYISVRANNLDNGHVKSCGCASLELYQKHVLKSMVLIVRPKI